ncbi:MAG: anhydro-N-acetylmuramic acid kinase [Candidatus Melainabacteria bacterium]|nr:anhydro-N-acetylmuramic acid kinase [Candidatus Melainabacteria bacterium]
MTNYVIGINSGTSFDGIDAALVSFKSGSLVPTFVNGITSEYQKIIKEKIENLIIGNGDIFKLSQLNFLLGEIFADAALEIIKKTRLRPKDILLIASHGQTIYHHPETENLSGYKVRSTLQIGESSVIAQRTGIKTISNFREADISADGQGAPLMPYLDWVFFNKSKNIKAILNIGGISNITITGKGIMPIAFDIGPGNALIDLISKISFKKDFDKDGDFARRGKIFFKSVERALRDPYFKKSPPKSTGKEYFNAYFIKKYFSRIKKKEDKLATVTYFTAKTIEKAFNDFVFPKYNVNEIVISGGGIKNKTLIKHLRKLLPDLRLSSSDKYKLPAKYKEAILFALLGYTCHLGKPNNIPSCTGAKKKVILGKIIKI